MTKTCPKCGANMIQCDTGTVLTSYPPQYLWNWSCNCGHTEHGGTRKALYDQELFKREWEAAQEKSIKTIIQELTPEEIRTGKEIIDCLDRAFERIQALEARVAYLESKPATNSRADYTLGYKQAIHDAIAALGQVQEPGPLGYHNAVQVIQDLLKGQP